MGIQTRKQGEVFVISSDRESGAAHTTRPPARISDTYQVWTGDAWSTAKDDAIHFESINAADEYVRANFAKILA